MKNRLLIIFLLIFTSTLLSAQIPKFEAIFIYNFTKYVKWPNNNAEFFTIGVIGNSDVYKELETIAKNKKVDNKTILIKTYKKTEFIDQPKIIFIGKSKSNIIAEIITKLGSSNTLIITEKEGLSKKGSAINFVIRDNKQKFELNATNATKYGLQVSNALSQLAIKVN